MAQRCTPAQFSKLREQHLARTITAIRETFTRDLLLTNCVETLADLETSLNQLATRLRQWATHFYPEASNATPDHATFAQHIATHTPQEINKNPRTMGATPTSEDAAALRTHAQHYLTLHAYKQQLETYLTSVTTQTAPSLTQLLGATLAAKLITTAGSLQRLARLPASTIQVLGAEASLFRHLTKGTPCPKHGFLFTHPLINQAPRWQRGKRSRALADAAAIAARVDSFKGTPLGNTLLQKLKKRFP